jgi:hypothetical protein
MGAREALIKAEIKTNDAETRIAHDPIKRGFRAIFLERAVESKDFSVVHECPNGYRFEYNGFRMLMVFYYATLLPDIGDLIARSTFMAIGVPNVDGLIDVYEIDPTRRDVVPPDADDPNWKLFLMRKPTERFTLS